MATGQVLRELNQVPASGEGPSRPWRARAKSDLQLGGAENLATLPPTCQGALALSGVLRRLQQVEEKVLQVTILSAYLCPCPILPAPHPSPFPSGSLPVFCLLCVKRQTWLTPSPLPWWQPSWPLSLSFSFLTLTAEEGPELG